MSYILYMMYWGWKSMCLAWAWYDICLDSWLYIYIYIYIYIYWHEIDMHGNSMIGWWNMDKVWVGRNLMTLIVGAHGGASSNGCNSTDPPGESPWWCLIYWI